MAFSIVNALTQTCKYFRIKDTLSSLSLWYFIGNYKAWPVKTFNKC